VRALTVALLFVHAGGAFGQEGCGSLANAFGPWDYTDPRNKRELANVNGNHFNANVRNLVRGQTSANIGGDIDYTLRAFPNHHRALAAMLRLSAKEGRERPLGATYTVGCYFERAVQFKPDDPAARLLYAKYLSGKDRHDEALAQLRQADQLDPEDGNIKYNMGLALFELKRYDEAADQARQAYALGFPLDGLRKKLERVGKWQPARN
jgi:tetratricopeptide (TPR) repeat protein